MKDNRQTPDLGPLAVTGATGGVGSLAVDIFSRAGFEVHAISGKPEHADYLKAIGASEVLGRDALGTTRPMESARFGGGLDNVGGADARQPAGADHALRQRRQRGTGRDRRTAHHGDALHHPRRIAARRRFGRHRARHPRSRSGSTWPATGSRAHLDRICTREIGLAQLPDVFATMLAGGSFGRTLVAL